MIEASDGAVLLRVKVVPNASRDQIVGPLGDDLKVKVAAPAEAGKANKAVRNLIAQALGIPLQSITIASGLTQPRKQLRIEGVTVEDATARLAP